MGRYMCWPVAQAMGRRVAVTRQRVENQCHFGGSPNFETVDKELEVHKLVTNLRQGSLCSRGHQSPVMSMYFQLLRRCSWGCSPNVFLVFGPPGSLDASWVSFWCLDMEVPCQVNRFTQPLSHEEWFQVSTLGQIWMELNHQEWHIRYSSYIDHMFNHIGGIHIFIIHSSIFNINQPTSSGKEAVNRKKTGGFFHHCSTTNIVQSFEPQPWFTLSVVQQVVLDVGRHGMFLQDIGSLGSSMYLTVKQVVYDGFCWPFLISSFSI